MSPSSAAQPDLPTDLVDLIRMYEALPPRTIRWRTAQGLTFLLALDDAAARYSVTTCASLLGIAPVTVHKLRRRRPTRTPVAYPSDAAMRPLRRAWRTSEAAARRGNPVARHTREFLDVHRALTGLLDDYELTVIAAALAVATRRLERFVTGPLPPPERVAQAVAARFPRTPRFPRSATPPE